MNMKRATNEDMIHLHCHTDGSNLRMKDSNVKTEQLIKYANSLGNKGVAITDHESLSSHIKAINCVSQLKEKGELPKDFNLILGNEIYLIDFNDLETKMENKDKIDFYHFILLAKDEIGHNQLRKLSSRAWRDNYFSYKGMNRVPTYYSDIEEVIGENKGHLIAQTACLGSYLGKSSELLRLTEDEEEQYNIKCDMVDFIEWCKDWFGEDFYLEIQPNTCEEQVFYNNLLVNIGKAYNVPICVTTDVHYLNKDMKELHKAYLTSEENEANREVDTFYDSTHFFTVEEIYDNLSYLDEDIVTKAILTTKEISNKINGNGDYGLFKPTTIPLTPLPKEEDWFPVNKDIINKYEYIKKVYEDKYDYHTYLIHKIFEGFHNRKIPQVKYPSYFERINTELEEIYKLSVDMEQPIGAYLTTMQKNIQEIWQTSIVAVGRGSVVTSIICYLLEIIDVNPLEQGTYLPHWRFIHRTKREMPKQYWAMMVNCLLNRCA